MRDVILPNADGFVPFPKIPRFFRDVVVTEKIDGTNGSILVGDDGSVRAASRNRILTPDKPDNFGFRAWVDAHSGDLVHILGPGHHFGEWMGKGIGRGYGLDERRFYLFNTSRWEGMTWEIDGQLRVVPVLYKGALDTAHLIFNLLPELEVGGSKAVPGFDKPEGIVVFHAAGSGTLFKYTFGGDAMKGNDRT